MYAQYFLLVILAIFYLYQTGTCDDTSGTSNLEFDTQSNLVQEESPGNDESFLGVVRSREEIEKWLEKEKELIEVLEKKLELVDEEIGLITAYLEDYDESTGEAMKHLHEPKETPEERGRVVGSSAVLGHRMISRYAGTIAHIRRFYTSADFLENEENLERKLSEAQEFNKATSTAKRSTPDSEDSSFAMPAFLHAQHSYGYRPSQLIYGVHPSNASHEARLNALECAEIGMFALSRKEYSIAVEWLEEAARLLTSWEDDNEFSLPLNIVTAIIYLAIQEHNRAFTSHVLRARAPTSTNFYNRPITPSGKRIPAESKATAKK